MYAEIKRYALFEKKDVLLVELTNLGVSLILWPKLKSDSAGSRPKLVIPVESLNLQ